MPPRAWLVRDVTVALWRSVQDSGTFATDHLAAAFRRERRIGSQERKAVSEALYGMLRQARRLDFALQPVWGGLADEAERDLARFLAWQVLEGGWGVEDAERLMGGVDWRTVVSVGQRQEAIADPVERFGVSHSLPNWISSLLMNEYGDEASALAQALNRRATLTVRANTLRIDREGLGAKLRDEGVESVPCRYSPTGLRLTGHGNVFSLRSFQDGLFEVQDEASQLVSMLVAPPPHSAVVDACAGAGGKTLALAALLNNQGRILALDPSRPKLTELTRRCRRAGISNVRALQIPTDGYPGEVEALSGKVKRVLTDVPCSGLGAMRRNPETRWRLQPADLERLPAVQFAIAQRALQLLPEGGRLIYATCTILRAENEDVVEKLLDSNKLLEVVRPAEILGGKLAEDITDGSGRFLKTLPHKTDTDGFFAAVLRRR